MKNIKALFIDCDGVLYDKSRCSYHDIAVVALKKTLDFFKIPMEAVESTRQHLKTKGIRGLFNTVLYLCNKRHIAFDNFATKMALYTDYTNIPKEREMLLLLKELAVIMPTYIVTNNTLPHLNKVFHRLAGGNYVPLEQSKIYPITIETTLAQNVFHTKKSAQHLTLLCQHLGQNPQNVLLLDDTLDVCEAAQAQGLQVAVINTPDDTKKIFKKLIQQKSKNKLLLPPTFKEYSQ